MPIKLGGEDKVVEIDESLFIKVKHNGGSDTQRAKVCYLASTIDILLTIQIEYFFFRSKQETLSFY